MNEREFESWYLDHCRTFPGTSAWLNDLGIELKSHQKRTWAAALAGVEQRDAMAATARMACGDEPPVPGYERELTGAYVRRIALGIAGNRETVAYMRREGAEHFQARGRDTNAVSLGGVFRELMRVFDGGGSKAEALAMVNARFPPVEERERRFRCPVCFDRKHVYVWSNESVEAAMEGSIGEAKRMRRAQIAYCECSRFDRERWAGGDERKKMRLSFFSDRLCLCPHGDVDSEANIAALVAWCQERLDARPAVQTEIPF